MNNQIIHGDFRDYLHLFSLDSYIISDPPYNQNCHYNEYADSISIDEYGKMLETAFSGQKSVIISYPEETINVVSKIMNGDVCEESVSWVYNSNTAKQHRLVTWWNCKPDMKKMGQPYKNPTDKRIAQRILDGKSARLYDWWEINQVKNVSKKSNPHPCPIPYELAKRIILLTVPEGGLVIDPFVGSGTICLAAKDCGRDYIGFEIDKKYFEYAKEKLSTPLT